MATAYLLLVTLHVGLEVYSDCTLYYDLGIYAEGMRKLSWQTPNPYLGARGLSLFADHFDPVAWLGAPLAKVGPAPYGAVAFEALVMLLAVVPLFVAAVRGLLPQRTASLLAVSTLFNAGAVTAVHYPVHPTTWAVAPMVALVVALAARQPTWALVAFVLLLACKEEFPFVGPPLAWLLWRANFKRHALCACALAGAWASVAFAVRPWVVGPTVPYWADPFRDFFPHPWAFLRERLTAPALRERLVLFALPLTPLLAWLARTHPRGLRCPTMWLAAPPMALRVLATRWYHQYHAVTMGAVTAAFLPGLGRREVPRSLFVVTVALLMLANHSVLKNAFHLARSGVTPQYPYCPMQRGRIDALARARAILRADPNARMIVGQNLLPKLVDLEGARLPAEFDHPPLPPYRWVLLEKPPHGKTWPLDDARIEALIARARAAPGTEVITDDEYLFLARGAFVD